MNQKIVVRKQDSLGVNEALDDIDYLRNCFIDLGDLQLLEDFTNKKCLVLGRTGVGKTALLSKLKEKYGEKVIVVNPESLAMRYLSNSTVIKYLISLDIDLNTFFKLLWRHVICVEIFIQHEKITSESEYEKLIDRVKYSFKKKNPKHLKALTYLEQWKTTFWQDTDSYTTEMIKKTEDNLDAAVSGGTGAFRAKLSAGDKLTQEEKVLIKQRGQAIVNDVQIQEVTSLLEMLDDFIEFHQARYYVVIDRLDEKWVGNDIRYKLIKSLIETLRDLNRLNNIKPIATLRYDLLGRVFDISKDAGFQEEKYTPLYLKIKWSQSQLIDLLNARINYQFQHRYSKKTKLTYTDVLPLTINGEAIMKYILDRSMMRPRDVIEFANFSIESATDKDEQSIINESDVVRAERSYSNSRLASLYFEWSVDYPGLKDIAKFFLRRKNHTLYVNDNKIEDVFKFCEKYMDSPPLTDIDSRDIVLKYVEDVMGNRMDLAEFRQRIYYILFRVGLIGLVENKEIMWNNLMSSQFEWDDIEDSSVFEIHKMYRTALRVN